jgi:histidyl-tRNA synthetase
MSEYERIKGFRDFYPDEMSARRQVIDTMDTVARQYGFREIGTPTLERTPLYIDKSGEEIVEELYAFIDEGGRELVLVPELTPTVARMVIAKQQALAKPIKWYSTRPFWRYEEPQQGRFREFYQTNVDIFGSAQPEADAEILAFTADTLTDLGLSPEDFEFRVSHRDVLGGLLETFETDTDAGTGGVDTHAAIRAVDKRAKIEQEEYYDLLVEAGLSYEQASTFDDLLSTADLSELTAFAGTERIEKAVTNLQNVLAATEDFGAREYCTLSLDTARGLDYYTGVVFECFDSTGEVSRSVFGGGRYDDLIESYGGQPTPAVGVALGHATLSLLLQRADVWPEESLSTDYYVLRIGDTRDVAGEIVRELRRLGHVVETDISGRSFSSQMSYADSINAETVVIVGEQDLANDEVTLKEMDSGDQTTVPLSEFPPEEGRPTYDDFI